jgi:hypothetical protein
VIARGRTEHCPTIIAAVGDVPADYDPHNSDFDDLGAMAQIDLMAMAMACDMTRVASLQFTQGWCRC